MNQEIATLHERMAKGGDWHAFRNEIAALHDKATTETEYVALLEAHRNLVAVGKFAYDDETYTKLLPIAAAEYRMFLNKEALMNGSINPTLLERITRREVEAGRLEPGDDLRKLSLAGASVLGDSIEETTLRCRQGNWFFYGVVIATALSVGFALVPLSPFWLILPGFVVGWYINERERKRSR